MQTNHQELGIFRWIQIRAVIQIVLEQLFFCHGEKKLSSGKENKRRWHKVGKEDLVVYFSPYAKLQCPLHLAPSSKRLEPQQQLLAFSKMRILEKRKLKSDKDYGSYDYKRVSVYLCPR